MRISVPSKTFLLGEYAVLSNGPALVLNTSPRFILTGFTADGSAPSAPALHPESPAGRLLVDHKNTSWSYSFYDPHRGSGGAGASGAEFLTIYAALKGWAPQQLRFEDLLSDYKAYAKEGSGVDVLSQAVGSVAYIDVTKKIFEPLDWKFKDLSFVLVRTGQKIPTHSHLSQLEIRDFADLARISAFGVQSFISNNAQGFVESISLYQKNLTGLGLCSKHTLALLEELNQYDGVVASKGCGAMGADVVCLLVWSEQRRGVVERLQKRFQVLATEDDLTEGLCFDEEAEQTLSREAES